MFGLCSGWYYYLASVGIIDLRLVWSNFCLFLDPHNSAFILQSLLFTNYWSNLLWCIVGCFFWWAIVAVGWVFCLPIISICIQGLIFVLAIYGSFSILLGLKYFLCLTTSKLFCWILIVAQFILTFNRHLNNCSFWFILLYQKFTLFLKKFCNFFIALLLHFHFHYWQYKRNSHHFVTCFVELLFKLDSLIFQLIALYWNQLLPASLIISKKLHSHLAAFFYSSVDLLPQICSYLILPSW